MLVLTALILGTLVLLVEAVGLPWWRLAEAPPLGLLAGGPPLAVMVAALLTLAGLTGLAALLARVSFGAVGRLAAAPLEPRWAAAERHERHLSYPEPAGRRPLALAAVCGGALAAACGALLLLIAVFSTTARAIPPSAAALPLVAGSLLAVAGGRALQPPPTPVPAPDASPDAPTRELADGEPFGAGWLAATLVGGRTAGPGPAPAAPPAAGAGATADPTEGARPSDPAGSAPPSPSPAPDLMDW